MKQLTIILIIGLFFISKSQAQYLGSELKMEQVQSSQPDYIITLNYYQDLTTTSVQDSIRLYFSRTQNVNLYSLMLGKIGQVFCIIMFTK